jgi:hypothetical protein
MPLTLSDKDLDSVREMAEIIQNNIAGFEGANATRAQRCAETILRITQINVEVTVDAYRWECPACYEIHIFRPPLPKRVVCKHCGHGYDVTVVVRKEK